MEFSLLKKRLSDLDAGHICDATTNVKIIGGGIKLMNPGLKLIGVAYTVDCEGDVLAVIKALHDAKPDEVIVINTHHSHQAVAGEIFATEAKRKKLAGFIIDGACRDSKALQKIDIPIFAKATCPQAGTKNKLGRYQVAIQCGDVIINPGDIILGDDDGIVAIQLAELNRIIDKAEAIRAREINILKQVSSGRNFCDMTNFKECYQALVEGNIPEPFKFKE